MTTSVVSTFWATVYAASFGWNWEILAATADPYDPDDDGRYVPDVLDTERETAMAHLYHEDKGNEANDDGVTRVCYECGTEDW